MNLVLVPGFLGDKTEFDLLISELRTLNVTFKNTEVLDFLNPNSSYKLSYSPDEWSKSCITQLQKKMDLAAPWVLIGYSMGGRLALRLAKTLREQLVELPQRIFAFSANPGFPQESKSARLKWINQWVIEFKAGNLEQALEKWNEQPVFKGSSQRQNLSPNLSPELLTLALENYDYQTLDFVPGNDLVAIKNNVKFFFGTLDVKYQGIKAQLERDFGSDLCINVPEAGHRLHFDQPSNTAKLLKEFL